MTDNTQIYEGTNQVRAPTGSGSSALTTRHRRLREQPLRCQDVTELIGVAASGRLGAVAGPNLANGRQ